MLKKFYFFFIVFSIFISIISTFSNSNNEFIYPTLYTNISSHYGYRILFGKENFHNGIDFLAPEGSTVYPISSGTVVYSDFMLGYGNTIIVSHIGGLKSLYGHLSQKYMEKVGNKVTSNNMIGYVGPKFLSDGRLNGNTTGPHLHITIFGKNGNTQDPLIFKYKKRK
ncbi:MAG: M23 family metallopeptidase [Clostridia bacterium]